MHDGEATGLPAACQSDGYEAEGLCGWLTQSRRARRSGNGELGMRNGKWSEQARGAQVDLVYLVSLLNQTNQMNKFQCAMCGDWR